MEITFIILIVILIIFLYLYLQNIKTKKNTSYKTKEDIINSYEKEVLIFNSKKLSKEDKSKFIKKIHKDLHNNIFFDDNETKTIIAHLISL